MKRLSVSTGVWSTKVVVAIYSVCFLIGTYTHTAWLLNHGFLAHPVPVSVSVYWDALTLLDPVTVVLLWWRPKVGVWLAVGVMASDISINTTMYLMGYFRPLLPNMVPLSLFLQSLFGLFVFVTAPWVYQQPDRGRLS